MAKLKVGDKIRIKKQVFVEKGSNFSLDVGEIYPIESLSVTGSVRITKNYSTGVSKKASVSKAYYEKA